MAPFTQLCSLYLPCLCVYLRSYACERFFLAVVFRSYACVQILQYSAFARTRARRAVLFVTDKLFRSHACVGRNFFLGFRFCARTRARRGNFFLCVIWFPRTRACAVNSHIAPRSYACVLFLGVICKFANCSHACVLRQPARRNFSLALARVRSKF